MQPPPNGPRTRPADAALGQVFDFGHSERDADFGHPFSHVFSPVTSVWRQRRAKRYNRPFSNTIAFQEWAGRQNLSFLGARPIGGRFLSLALIWLRGLKHELTHRSTELLQRSHTL